jgi:hypothetical protein
MPFGTSILELLSFFHQVSLSLAGAAGLWGLIFYLKAWRKSRKNSGEDMEAVFGFQNIAGRMIGVIVIGSVIGAITWLLMSLNLAELASAHVGIVITATYEEIRTALAIKLPFLILTLLVTFIGLLAYKKWPKKLFPSLGLFFAVELVLLSILVSIPAWSGDWGREQFFHFAHNWHSVLTLGTVIIIDYLFHLSYRSETLRESLYPNFEMMSKAIWIGVTIELIAVYAIFANNETFLSDKFFFMHTLIGIIIINGVLLAGPMTRKLKSLVDRDGMTHALDGTWEKIAGFSGVLSIVSWTTITFVDSFKDLTLSLGGFFLIYAFFYAIGYLSYYILKHPYTRSYSPQGR